MSILKRILNGQAPPAVMRPVPLVPQAARAEAVQTLELRIKGAMPLPAEERDRLMESAPFPGARSLLMAAGRVRQAEEGKVAQLERELVMERLRTKELREQLEALSLELDFCRHELSGSRNLKEVLEVVCGCEVGNVSVERLQWEYEALSKPDVAAWFLYRIGGLAGVEALHSEGCLKDDEGLVEWLEARFFPELTRMMAEEGGAA